MEFFPFIVLVILLFLNCLCFVFAVCSEILTSNQSVVIGFVGMVTISIILIFLFVFIGFWAIAWLAGSLLLSIAIYWNWDGTKPTSDKE